MGGMPPSFLLLEGAHVLAAPLLPMPGGWSPSHWPYESYAFKPTWSPETFSEDLILNASYFNLSPSCIVFMHHYQIAEPFILLVYTTEKTPSFIGHALHYVQDTKQSFYTWVRLMHLVLDVSFCCTWLFVVMYAIHSSGYPGPIPTLVN